MAKTSQKKDSAHHDKATAAKPTRTGLRSKLRSAKPADATEPTNVDKPANAEKRKRVEKPARVEKTTNAKKVVKKTKPATVKKTKRADVVEPTGTTSPDHSPIPPEDIQSQISCSKQAQLDDTNHEPAEVTSETEFHRAEALRILFAKHGLQYGQPTSTRTLEHIGQITPWINHWEEVLQHWNDRSASKSTLPSRIPWTSKEALATSKSLSDLPIFRTRCTPNSKIPAWGVDPFPLHPIRQETQNEIRRQLDNITAHVEDSYIDLEPDEPARATFLFDRVGSVRDDVRKVVSAKKSGTVTSYPPPRMAAVKRTADGTYEYVEDDVRAGRVV